jgi:hypothetical protein
VLRYVLINKPTGHHPGAPLGGFPQETSRRPSIRVRLPSLETIGARLLLWETPSFMPEANPRQKASFTPTPILTNLIPNVPILSFPGSPIRRSPGQQYYQHAPPGRHSAAPRPPCSFFRAGGRRSGATLTHPTNKPHNPARVIRESPLLALYGHRRRRMVHIYRRKAL